MREPWIVECLSAKSRNKALLTCGLLVLGYFFWEGWVMRSAAASQVLVSPAQVGPLAVVNAASFSTTALAPESIAAAYGTGLATQSDSASGATLPTMLAGTAIEVNGLAAGLFFVSPGQINFLLPAALVAGPATVTVRVNNSIVARGVITIRLAAPGIFTANATGQGVPAAQLYLPANVVELVADCSSQPCQPRPLNLCSGQARLVLYLTGLRFAADPNRDGNANESVRVQVSGQELIPEYAGKQNGLAGLDQLNVLLPASLASSGRITFVVTVTGTSSTNPVELNLTAAGGLQIERFDPLSVVAGQPLAINGAGFSSSKERNVVRLLGAETQADAQVVNAVAGQLTVLIPFGAESGRLSVTNLDGQCGAGISLVPLAVRTSLSGFFKDTSGAKLKGVRIKVLDASNIEKETRTNDEGAFILADLAPGAAEVEVDGTTASGALPFPKYRFRKLIRPARDNPLEFPGSLQAVTGVSSNLLADGKLAESALELHLSALPVRSMLPPIINGNVRLDVPDNATIRLDGLPVPRITLSLVGNDVTRTRALTLVALPTGEYSSTIVQIAPLGALISPGAKLTFPNSDGFPANAQVKLFRLDQRRGSPTLGEFIPAGSATVSADGQRIETEPNAVTETSVYFVSAPRPTITVIGSVLEADRTPVRRALLGSRGRSVFTDNGGFIVSNVPVNVLPAQLADGAVIALDSAAGRTLLADELLSIEANYLRPTGATVARKENNEVQPTGNIASAGVLVLDPPPSVNPPVITAAATFRVFAGQPQDFPFIVDRGGGQSVRVSVTGASFATIKTGGAGGNDTYTLSLSPSLNERGTYTLALTAVNDLGVPASKSIVVTVQ